MRLFQFSYIAFASLFFIEPAVAFENIWADADETQINLCRNSIQKNKDINILGDIKLNFPLGPVVPNVHLNTGGFEEPKVPQLNLNMSENLIDLGNLGTNNNIVSMFDSSAKSALARIYDLTGSSDKAKKMVEGVLNKNGCNGSVVAKLPMQDWGVQTGWGQNPTPHFDHILADGKAELTQIQNEIWKNLGHTSGCAETLDTVDRICSGQLTPEALYAELHKNDKNGEVAVGGVGIWFLKTVGEAVISETISKMVEAANTPDKEVKMKPSYYKNQDEHLHSMLEANKVFKGVVDLHISVHGADSKMFPDQKDSVTAGQKLNELNEKIGKLEKDIKKNQDEWIDAYPETHLPEKHNAGEAPELVDPNAIENFKMYVWLPMLKEMEKRNNKCINQEDVRPEAMPIVPAADEGNWSLGGTTCNYEKALLDLKLVGSPDGHFYQEKEKYNFYNSIEHKLQLAHSKLPECIADPSDLKQVEYCRRVMDQHYKNNGIDGGAEEVCIMTGWGCDAKKTFLDNIPQMPENSGYGEDTKKGLMQPFDILN